MRLVLVNSSKVHIVVGSEPSDRQLGYWVKLKDNLSSGALKRKRDHDWNENEEVKLTREILADNRSMGVNLSLFTDLGEIELDLLHGHKGPDPLQRLWDRFQDEVILSVCLKYATEDGGELFDYVEKKGLTIDPEEFDCRGTIPTNKTKLEHFPVMHMTVVADVPDRFVFSNPLIRFDPFSKKILEMEKFSDVTICAGNGAEIKAHKVFLSACSPVFEAMFDSDMEESNTGKVDMTDLSEEGIKAFLRYVYYNDLKVAEENVDVGFQVLYVAHKYNVRSLEAKMTTFLIDRKSEDFGTELAFKMYMFTRNIESTIELKEKAIQILKYRLDELESLNEYNELFKKNPDSAMEVFKDFAKPSSI